MVFAKRQAAALATQGHFVHEFYLASRTQPIRVWHEWLRMRREIRLFNPDIVLAAFGTVTGFLTVTATARPTVITFRGSDLNPSTTDPWLRSTVGRFLSQIAALRATRIICVSQQLRRRLWWHGEHTTVIPTGVDTRVFRPMSRAVARHLLGWDDGPVVLFYAGGDPRGKRLDVAEAALTRLQQQLPGVRLEVMRGGVAPDRVPLYMNAADCLLVTSNHEGSPTVVQEALACHLPIVTVPVGDVVNRLAGVQTSAIVARNPDLLARAMEPILCNLKRADSAAAAHRCANEVVGAQVLDVLRAATKA